MYNTLTIKSDILNLGSWSFAPIYIRGLVNKGYKAHESFRVFDMEHELNVALVSKVGLLIMIAGLYLMSYIPRLK